MGPAVETIAPSEGTARRVDKEAEPPPPAPDSAISVSSNGLAAEMDSLVHEKSAENSEESPEGGDVPEDADAQYESGTEEGEPPCTSGPPQGRYGPPFAGYAFPLHDPVAMLQMSAQNIAWMGHFLQQAIAEKDQRIAALEHELELARNRPLPPMPHAAERALKQCNICEHCRQLKNLAFGDKGEYSAIFCGSCVMEIQRSSHCQRRGCSTKPFVDPVGAVARYCSTCHKDICKSAECDNLVPAASDSKYCRDCQKVRQICSNRRRKKGRASRH